MFEQLSERLDGVFKKLTGQATLTEENIRESMREVRRALLEADVHIKVAKEFTKTVEERAIGLEVQRKLNAGQQVIQVVHDVLVETLGGHAAGLVEARELPTRIMLVGLQGSGKTTSAAKLGFFLRKKRKKVPLLAACDVYRPAAMEQLETLAKEVGLHSHVELESTDAIGIATRALAQAKQIGADYLIVDTAGRLHIDDSMMEELEQMKRAVRPHQLLLVVDGMSGQDAVTAAASFHERLGIDGVILTKMDGDARGGAALSIRSVTGIPILFLGMGERPNALEPFHPDRMAQRILGMGDVLTLVERAQEQVSAEEARKLEEQLRKKTFTFEEFLDQLRKIKKMGPMEDLLRMIPGVGNKLPAGFSIDEKQFGRIEAIIQSMTRKERLKPEIIDGSRRKRIAKGSGTSVQEVNRLLKDFQQMRKMMSQLTKMGPRKFMRMVRG
jgi:signal recognition particle subunit SRP54